jgi:DNA-directed RNA polymerase I and III subunit RPAC1
VHEDIILAKLRPGQSLEVECHVIKGIGASHAKWSPVATASYRLMPKVEIMAPLRGAEAQALVDKCPLNVFDIEDMGNGEKGVTVARVRNCTMCRECIREPGWDEEKVRLSRVRDHFLFTIESTGVYTPADLFRECVKVLASKCQTILTKLEEH